MFQFRLKEMREKFGLSQADLAKTLGVGQSTVAMWESGRNRPGGAKLEALASLFGVSTDYLLGREEIKSQPAAESGELDKELITLLTSLSPAEVQRVRDFVAGLKASRGAPASGHRSDHE